MSLTSPPTGELPALVEQAFERLGVPAPASLSRAFERVTTDDGLAELDKKYLDALAKLDAQVAGARANLGLPHEETTSPFWYLEKAPETFTGPHRANAYDGEVGFRASWNRRVLAGTTEVEEVEDNIPGDHAVTSDADSITGDSGSQETRKSPAGSIQDARKRALGAVAGRNFDPSRW